MKIHHIGYLVEDMDAARKEFVEQGAVLDGDRVFDERRLVDITFIKLGTAVIELVCPREGSSDVGRSLRKLKNTPYHLCFECSDLDGEIAQRTAAGSLLVKDPEPAPALGNRRVAFLYSGSIGLYELVEQPEGGE